MAILRSHKKTKTFEIDEKAIYRPMFGQLLRCTITEESEKNGCKVYSCTLENGEERWGYEDQFFKISK